MSFFIFSAQLDYLIETDEQRIIIIPQTFGVPVNDFLQKRQFILDFQEFIGLLLVVDNGEFGIGMGGDIFHFGRNAIDKDTGRNAAGGLDGELAPEPFRLVISDDADHIARLQTQADQTQREIFDLVVIFLPGKSLPDAEALHAHGRPVAPFQRIAADNLGNSLQRFSGCSILFRY